MAAIIILSSTACGDAELKSQGQQCFGSTECEPGLTCDFGQTPAVCSSSQSNQTVDAGPVVPIDADLNQPDADLSVPDAALPDASPPDAALPDANLLDADLSDAAV